MIQPETTPPSPKQAALPTLAPGLSLYRKVLARRLLPSAQATMWLVVLLTICCLASSTHGTNSPGFCSQDLNLGVKPGFPTTVKTNNPEVLKAARHSVEKFNNCTDDIFLYKESHISRALVQVVKGLKYMLEVEISRTICRKNTHARLDHCDFQSNPTLKQTLSCYSEVWVIPWLHSFEVPVLRCHRPLPLQ